MQKVWVLILTIATFQTVFSQDTIRISKTELEQKILDNNLQVKMAQKEAELADAEL